MTEPITDFASSYVTWFAPHNPDDRRVPGHKPWGNGARILFDARCTITESAGASEEFFLIVPCRNEWMYQEEEIFLRPGGEYRVIYSRDRQRSVGKRLIEEGERPASTTTAQFSSLVFTVRHYAEVTPLGDDAAVLAATRANLPITARTELWDEASGRRAVLEYPIKTMNFHPERMRFQVDTGPLIFPDLAADVEHAIDRCALAHVVYNRFDRGEFVCKRPTPIFHEGREVARVFDYSDFRSVPARHALYAGGRL